MDWPAAAAKLRALYRDDEELRHNIAGRLLQQRTEDRESFFSNDDTETRTMLLTLLPPSGMQTTWIAIAWIAVAQLTVLALTGMLWLPVGSAEFALRYCTHS